MKNNILFKAINIMLCVILVLLCANCTSSKTIKSDYESSYFRFDTSSILNQITISPENIFVRVDWKGFQQGEVLSPVTWEQEDYWLVASSFFATLGIGPITDWNVKLIDYDMDCNEVNYGTQWFYLEVFREMLSDGRINREVKRIIIAPSNSYLELVEYSYQNTKENWESVDISKLSNKLSEILQIIKLNGGNEAREKSNNNCDISISIESVQNKPVWTIVYGLLPDAKLLYELQIDDKSKAVSIIQPLREEILPKKY